MKAVKLPTWVQDLHNARDEVVPLDNGMYVDDVRVEYVAQRADAFHHKLFGCAVVGHGSGYVTHVFLESTLLRSFILSIFPT